MNESDEIRQRLKTDFEFYARNCLKIRTKNGSIEPFVLNRAQKHIHAQLEKQLKETGKVRALILKARQQGCSSYTGGRYYHHVTHSFGCQAFILAHELNATNNLFGMVKRFYEHTPAPVKPSIIKSNSKELLFNRIEDGISCGLDSGYKLGTAGNKQVGRSNTIQLLHLSEAGFYENAAELSTGLLQAVPDVPGTEIIMESTANGVGNYFHQEWQKAESGMSDFIPIFIPWFWQEEYKASIPSDTKFTPTPEEEELSAQYMLTYEQLLWRRKKIVELSVNGVDGEKSFFQEYPSCSHEAFILSGENTFIESSLVVRARHERVDGYGPVVIGVDPARFGDDRTSIIFRQGRKAYNLQSYTKKDTMEVAGIVYTLIQEHKPAKVFVDVGGLGAGVVDRLHELVDTNLIVGVNAGSSPFDANKYKNKRAELWGELKAWLSEGNVQIPDANSLHADICGIRYKVDSNSRLQMESKEDMKKRGLRSSDESDALCLTFSLPQNALNASINNTQNTIVDNMAQSFLERQQLKAGSPRRY